MKPVSHPLAEVFGFPTDSMSPQARRYRENRLCPFGNVVPNCTKDKANSPLGVCSIYHGHDVVITCPVRFREEWTIAEDAASFFFDSKCKWTTLTEVRLKDANGRSAGNVDVVLVAYDDVGKITDFGALEVQAVYISGNIRNPFEYYMQDPTRRKQFDCTERPNYPNPDYLSSSRKRLAPQLIFKGGIFRAWNKKIAVALHKGFFETLPKMDSVERDEADMAWFIYDLAKDESAGRFRLQRHAAIYSRFSDSLDRITRSEPGDMTEFVQHLQEKVDERLESGNPPDTETIDKQF